MDEVIFCRSGGCTAKLGPGALERVLSLLPKGEPDPDLLIGYDSHDDAAVYRVSDELAVVQTLDFFPPMVEDPYLFGQIAAANALSDIYAMGGEVRTALNIVCFPEKLDLNLLGRILQGGSEKVMEAGGVLAGGHSISDEGIKYGLSVMGFVDPRRMYANNTPQEGDALVLTKKLGVGIVCAAHRAGEASEQAMAQAIASMTTLNKYAAQTLKDFDVHACTDVTGFSLLGHLHEMLDRRFGAELCWPAVPAIEGALDYAAEFLLTGAAQRNRNHLQSFVRFEDVPFPVEELLFDPQTSGGLLCAVPEEQAQALVAALGSNASRIGTVTSRGEHEIIVKA